ncbi:MAG: ABC transporter ATP-binding protein [Dorea sp.]|nr:ABC transporter ATP-binding protein [Dorea sp.]
MELYTINELSKSYVRWNIRSRKKSEICVLKKLNLTINNNEFICIIGKSGVGKTTLLKMLGGIEKPSAGSILYTDMELYKCPETKMEEYRRKEIGFIFQDYKLLDELTVQENILIPQILDGVKREAAESKMDKITELFGINDKKNFYTYELSGGEKQRAAICRALINNPKVILADEPTGNLDSVNTELILKVLLQIKVELKKTIIMVTHDEEICKYADRVIKMENDQIKEIFCPDFSTNYD